MNSPSWIATLRPVGAPRLVPVSPDSDLLAWHAEIQFERWIPSQNADPLPRSATYGKTQVLGEGGIRSVAEIELVRRLRAAGWRAGWADTFGSAPETWAAWILTVDALPQPLREAYVRIKSAAAP